MRLASPELPGIFGRRKLTIEMDMLKEQGEFAEWYFRLLGGVSMLRRRTDYLVSIRERLN
jgi:hypothetical protein